MGLHGTEWSTGGSGLTEAIAEWAESAGHESRDSCCAASHPSRARRNVSRTMPRLRVRFLWRWCDQAAGEHRVELDGRGWHSAQFPGLARNQMSCTGAYTDAH